ncbi:FAD-dependent thymidylate synthase [Phorcysia thermohydrogeniphila]|uniref:Thymidylate synthase Thy1 n=1 Tax=Phorcysia thermohydrogeniphila TaxID=936138 RepID=A0A4V2PDI5_9BACT|nr:FAD-dependent thymidylate synthase [Phorcysia thermohydrogeniphila]TCK05346.1 thymidylate synthase Thy1 [Phorcysia thermohydrogeniphila]
MGITLLSQTDDMLKVIATAARVCYSGLPLEQLLSRYSEEEDRRLIKKVVGMGHLSVVEHGVMTFKVDDSFKEELFRIMIDKPFLKITETEDGFIVSLNLRTMIELLAEKPELRFTKEISKFLPDFLPKPKSQQ